VIHRRERDNAFADITSYRFSEADWAAGKKECEEMARSLCNSPNVSLNKVDKWRFGHQDFTWALDAERHVYDPVIARHFVDLTAADRTDKDVLALTRRK